jgi:hypothetical protein
MVVIRPWENHAEIPRAARSGKSWIGRGGRTRTCDPRIRNPMLYPPELHPRTSAMQLYRNSLVGVVRMVQPLDRSTRADSSLHSIRGVLSTCAQQVPCVVGFNAGGEFALKRTYNVIQLPEVLIVLASATCKLPDVLDGVQLRAAGGEVIEREEMRIHRKMGKLPPRAFGSSSIGVSGARDLPERLLEAGSHGGRHSGTGKLDGLRAAQPSPVTFQSLKG